MRVVLDTNVFISGLAFPQSAPGLLLKRWDQGRFKLLTCEELIFEFRRASRYFKLRDRYAPASVGKVINNMRSKGIFVAKLPLIDRAIDPWDNYLLALAEVGRADFVVTGDKAGLLPLGRHGTAQIVTVRDFLERL